MLRPDDGGGAGNFIGSVVLGDYVDDSTGAHGQHLPSLYFAADSRRRLPGGRVRIAGGTSVGLAMGGLAWRSINYDRG